MTSPDLTALLRASRPAAPAALRDRVRELAVGAEEESLARWTLPLGRIRMPQVRLVFVPAAAVLVLVSSAAVVGLVRSDAPSSPVALEAARDAAAADAKGYESAPPIASGAPSTTTTTRPQRYQAELTLQVDDADALSRATQRALTLTRSLGGYIVSSSFDADGDQGISYVTVRVPSNRVQEAIVRLTGLGQLQAQRVAIDDLGQQIDELDRRSGALTAEIAQLVRELAKRGLTVDERLAVRTRLSEARRELSDVRAQRVQTTQEARYATVFLTLVTPDAGGAVGTSGTRIDRALDGAWDALLWEFVAVVYALIVLAPLALAGVGAWLATRGMRRHQDRQLLDQPGS